MARIEDHFQELKTMIDNSVKGSIQAIQEADLDKFKMQVKDTIQSGLSPVEGAGRFVEYSDMYKKQIDNGKYTQYGKKLRPINLTLTGAMMNSLYTEKTEVGFAIGFKDPKAFSHTVVGLGHDETIRKLLPQKGEYFSRTISSFLLQIMTQSYKDAFNNAFKGLKR